ncbi:MAG TPA: FAD-dependent oxidoreductase, partial [Saprospiraceae bacterium]|nr:FAD-dependent oxidoreductase [Saprospiraceae bacterium]
RLNRTGGRLDTDLIRAKDENGQSVEIREEEGGMRFTYQMESLMSLFTALDLCNDIVDFPMSDPTQNNRYFFRGHGFTLKESAENQNAIWSELYNLKPEEQGLSPVQIITNVYNQILYANDKEAPDNPTPEFWQDFRLNCQWKGKTLNKWQLAGLLRNFGYSEECINMLSHAIGFAGPFLSLANAGEAFQILEDFPKNPHYHTLKDGFSTLPNTLTKKIKEMASNRNQESPIHLGVNLDKIEKSGAGYKVEYTRAPKGESAYNQMPEGKPGEIVANKVILAIASNAMEKLFVKSPALHKQKNAPQFLKDIRSTLNMKLLKINLYFDKPWWTEEYTSRPGFVYGPSFTDLPINSAYPFYAIKGDIEESIAALTLYLDFNNVNFWKGLQNIKPFFDSEMQQMHSKPPQVMFPATEAVVEEAMKQLGELFGTTWIPRPVLTSFRSWSGEDDFGYAYHQWALDVQDDEVMERMIEPVPNIYGCNEAWSDMQGWVNGSLRSTDLVMKRIGLKAITELYQPCSEPKKD